MSHPAYNQPTQTTAIEGEVVLIGPDGLAVSITPDAAEETARRLVKSSSEARAQSPPFPED